MPSKTKPRLHNGRSGAAIILEVVYGAKDNRLRKKRDDGVLVLELTKQEQDPGLNQTILEYLAESFQVPLKNYQIIDGSDQKKKLIGIYGLDSDALQNKIDSLFH